MSPWIRIGAPLMSVMLGIVAGSAAYAMRDNAPSGSPAPASSQRSALRDESTNAAAICIEGSVDCNDTTFGGGSSDAGCTPEECGVAPTPYCPTVDTCVDPGMPIRPCPEDMPADACAQRLPPLDGGYWCVYSEGDGGATECKSIGCPDAIEGAPCGFPCSPGGPVTILPAPAPDEPIANPPRTTFDETPITNGGTGGSAIVGEATAVAVDGGGTDLGVEPIPVDPPVCVPIDPCGPRPLEPGVRDEMPICLPPECSVSSDGAIACPEPPPCVQPDRALGATDLPCAYPEPCTGGEGAPCTCASNGTETFCKPLPPDCAIGSDGSVSCGGSAPTEPICPDDPTVSCANSGATNGSSGSGSSNAGSASSPPVSEESR